MSVSRAQGCLALVAFAGWLGGCSAVGAEGPAGSTTGDSTTSAAATSGAGGGLDASTSASAGTGGVDPQTTTGTGFDPDEACAVAAVEATADVGPADIVIAVDTSGSMSEESEQVQQNLNAFAEYIAQSGVDVRVVLIAGDTVCIPAPLGSGSCPGDDNLPKYRHVHQNVESHDGLSLILSTYPQWKDSLRAHAAKVIGIVSDDDSDLGAAGFTQGLLALDPPTFDGFRFNSIVASDPPEACVSCFLNCGSCASKCCNPAEVCSPISADEGKVYKELTSQTNGVFGDLCGQDFAPVFNDMANGVVQAAAISCEYPIPPAGDDVMLDPGKVNVLHTPGGGAEQTILKVPGGAESCGAQGGWYYDEDNGPTAIVLCPTTCDTIQNDADAKVLVQFGCATQVVPN